MGEIFAMLPSDVHYQCAVTTMAKKYDLPRVFYLDLWPMADGQVCVTGSNFHVRIECETQTNFVHQP
jgi:hypothetical protein